MGGRDDTQVVPYREKPSPQPSPKGRGGNKALVAPPDRAKTRHLRGCTMSPLPLGEG